MAKSWAYGVTDQGEAQLLGPFESDDEANEAAAELNNVRILYAPDRAAAIRQLQGGRAAPRGRRREPMGDYEREKAEMDREFDEELAQYDREMAMDE